MATVRVVFIAQANDVVAGFAKQSNVRRRKTRAVRDSLYNVLAWLRLELIRRRRRYSVNSPVAAV